MGITWKDKLNGSIRNKMFLQAIITVLPFLLVVIYLMYSMMHYNNTYKSMINSMTVANNYNLNFKDSMDESLYKLVVGYTTFHDIEKEPDLQDPYDLIADMRREFGELERNATEPDCKIWLGSLLRNIDTLEKRVDVIRDNLKKGGKYNENIEMLDSDIYILTELIQDDIQHYISYQTKSMDNVSLSLQQQIHDFMLLTGVLVAALIMVVSMYTYTTVSGMLSPLNELHHAMDRVSQGDFKARAKVTSKDELATLATGFNSMAANMQGLIDEIKEDEQKLHRMDLRLLQEQINPHFLYNTLDTIVWLIEGNEPEQAVEMVVHLSGFFRLVLSKGKEFISIAEEKRHISTYLEIQKMRYGDIMEYEISFDKVIYDYEILKLSLQPIVENALYHGIKYKRSKGYVHITGEKEGDVIHLAVRDNGVGLSEEELKELQSAILKPCNETEKGFGLANVNERIRMYYGSQYGMRIESEKDKGTLVEITIPAIRHEKEEHNEN
ncbi:MAG: sensor histidine kinase [Lachnospiraceae bacterium]|nr:sensor histidine kinase [Lachnospiraceae bacterium]